MGRRLLWWFRRSNKRTVAEAQKALKESVADRRNVEEVLQRERKLIHENNFGPKIYNLLRGRL